MRDKLYNQCYVADIMQCPSCKIYIALRWFGSSSRDQCLAVALSQAGRADSDSNKGNSASIVLK